MHYSTMCQIKSNQTNSMLKEVIHGHDNRFRALYGDVCVCACVCVCVCVCACVRACAAMVLFIPISQCCICPC